MSDRQVATPPAPPTPSNRVGLRDGSVSELTVIVPLKPGGADRLRAILQAQGGRFALADRVGSVHDMRFVIIDNDTRLIFATTYDGDWDSYINDFATKLPEALDRLFADAVDYPGIASPAAKDYIAAHQITASGWYCGYPDATVADIRRGQRTLSAFEQLLDAAGG